MPNVRREIKVESVEDGWDNKPGQDNNTTQEKRLEDKDMDITEIRTKDRGVSRSVYPFVNHIANPEQQSVQQHTQGE